jgi:hypothetical protein
MRVLTTTLTEAVERLHRDEVGADEGMNKLLIFAMVALPLLALLIFFGGEIVTFAKEQFDTVFGGGGVEITN